MTGNDGKLAEVRHRLGPLGWDVQQLMIAGRTPELVEPQADMLEDVARFKLAQAKEILAATGKAQDAVMVEDAGLFIDSLQGFPGVYSAYALQTIGCQGIINLLADEVEPEGRSASFHAVAMVWDGHRTHSGSGRCSGWIAPIQSGSGGFGFDPIFIPCDLDADGEPLELGKIGFTGTGGLTFGSISIDDKQRYSHRRRALDALIDSLDAPSA